jgi:hypothetical protein
MQIERIRQTEEAILAALATYRYLTAEQMLRLDVTPSLPHLYASLRTLVNRKPALLVELDFGVLPTRGRLPRLYVLTRRGAELLAAHAETSVEIDAPKQVSLFSSDYFHRIACVDFHIALRTWAAKEGVVIEFYHTYYDPVQGTPRGGRLAPKTHVKLASGALVPDVVFAMIDSSGTRRLCVFEMYNGRRTERVVGQLGTYLTALSEEALNKAYDYKRAVRVLLGFDTPENMRLVAERVARDPGFASDQGHFFLAPLSVIGERFFDGWQRFDSTPTTLY